MWFAVLTMVGCVTLEFLAVVNVHISPCVHISAMASLRIVLGQCVIRSILALESMDFSPPVISEEMNTSQQSVYTIQVSRPAIESVAQPRATTCEARSMFHVQVQGNYVGNSGHLGWPRTTNGGS